jgi:hypothetical protein
MENLIGEVLQIKNEIIKINERLDNLEKIIEKNKPDIQLMQTEMNNLTRAVVQLTDINNNILLETNKMTNQNLKMIEMINQISKEQFDEMYEKIEKLIPTDKKENNNEKEVSKAEEIKKDTPIKEEITPEENPVEKDNTQIKENIIENKQETTQKNINNSNKEDKKKILIGVIILIVFLLASVIIIDYVANH